MNQILISEKLIVTPEMRRKKKFYKFNFFISVFLICILFSYYIYAEYDRNKNEKVSREILMDLQIVEEHDEPETQETEIMATNNAKIKLKDNVLVVVLDNKTYNSEQVNVSEVLEKKKNNTEQNTEPEVAKHVTEDGTTYYTEAILNIPSLGIEYPILSETSESLLKISLNKLWGPNVNEVGNYVIVGHNYKSKKMFGKLSEINKDDIIKLTDLKGRTVQYSVYDKYVIEPTDVKCTSQLTNGKREVTLITCTNAGKQRLVVKAREVRK